ncbi:hypothetical protein L6452_29749 [Arctium lappa]|uniref:Uncharacterized protein n=1 Tax=Arctium lappa TaxID=4217 RepID=A0ACB8ZHR4_ARCLA|nr:hypothetical protein L6452_29749 [Arctium lappa]
MVAYARSLGCNDVQFSPEDAGSQANTSGVEDVIISTHYHNDIGMATANTLEGAYLGARQVEVTINEIGERAGNASLEEVEKYSGMLVQPHKAIVGANAFVHESGIHQLGYDFEGKELNDLFWRFKSVAEMKKVITDDDLMALVLN